jgi:hypothetical protein
MRSMAHLRWILPEVPWRQSGCSGGIDPNHCGTAMGSYLLLKKRSMVLMGAIVRSDPAAV